MSLDFDIVTRVIELIFGMATTIVLFVIMVYRLSYRLNDLSERFKENNDFIKEFKKNFGEHFGTYKMRSKMLYNSIDYLCTHNSEHKL